MGGSQWGRRGCRQNKRGKSKLVVTPRSSPPRWPAWAEDGQCLRKGVKRGRGRGQVTVAFQAREKQPPSQIYMHLFIQCIHLHTYLYTAVLTIVCTRWNTVPGPWGFSGELDDPCDGTPGFLAPKYFRLHSWGYVAVTWGSLLFVVHWGTGHLLPQHGLSWAAVLWLI